MIVAPPADVAARACGATESVAAPDKLMSLVEAAHQLGINVAELRRDVS
jgi:hypothetical protein